MPPQRMTRPTLLVIEALLAGLSDEHYGYRISQSTGLRAGTVQPILTRMEADGWLTSRWEDIDPHVEQRRPRRLYSLTGDGVRALSTIWAEHRHRLAVPQIVRPGVTR